MGGKTCKKYVPYLILGAVSILLLFRSFFSFSWSDESFYLTVVHRFWLGERMFADEWYTTQLSAPLLLPFYALYQWLTGGNEGVYLYFRLLYWAISSAVAFLTYGKLKKRNSSAASLLCALLYLLYSRANIGGMSYYNMTLTLVLLAALSVYDQLGEGRAKRWQLYWVGVLLALAVVFTPFLAVPYVVLALYLLCRRKYRCLRREVLTAAAGTATAAFAYLGYVFRQVSLTELMENVPHILNEPELQSTNPLLAIPIIFARIAWRYKWTVWAIALLCIFIRYRKKKRGEITDRELLRIAAADFLLFAVNSYFSANMVGCINIAGVLFVLPLLYAANTGRSGAAGPAVDKRPLSAPGAAGKREASVSRTAEDKRILSVFGTAGCSLLLAFSFSSDTGLDALTVGFVVLGMGALLLAFRAERLCGNGLLYGVALTAACVMAVQTGLLRFCSVYRDAPIGELDTQITSGPARFLCTTQEHARQYAELEAAIAEYVREGDIVFYSKWCFWSYLCSDNEYGVSSSWRMPFDSPRLEEYYAMNPEKIPTCIFVLNPVYGDYESSLIQGNEKAERPNENNLEGFLWDYIQEQGYEVIETECATVYRSRAVD